MRFFYVDLRLCGGNMAMNTDSYKYITTKRWMCMYVGSEIIYFNIQLLYNTITSNNSFHI
jgi:hypothetical protein